MGQTEWRDLGAAARYAFAHGARHLILVGYSMGGAIVSQFMERSPLAPRVAGLVLDAPALDWKEILSFNATRMGFPAFAALPVEWAIGALPRHRGRCRADLNQRRLRRGAAAPGHLLPSAPSRPHRGLERRPCALRTPARRLSRFRGSLTTKYAGSEPRNFRLPFRGSKSTKWVDREPRSGRAQEIGGRASAQGRSASSWAASESRVASSPGRPTIWTESGMPSAAKPAGTAIDGLPRWFQGMQ